LRDKTAVNSEEDKYDGNTAHMKSCDKGMASLNGDSYNSSIRDFDSRSEGAAPSSPARLLNQ